MINQEKWVGSLPNINVESRKVANQLDHERWMKTIPKKEKYRNAKKYSLFSILFVLGLLLVSAVKNETRNLQKEINKLEASIKGIKFNLNQAILDNEVINSPEKISLLAKEHLDIDLVSYKKSQIKQLGDKEENLINIDKIKKQKAKELSENIKTQIAKKIEDKKEDIKELQKLYYNPKSIPGEIKTQVAISIEEKKSELKNMYSSPNDIFTFQKVGKWTVVQVVKLFLGMPVIPGR